MADALARFAERFWQFQRHEFPLTAFMAGQPNDDPTMFREGPADHERRALAAVAMLAELDRIPADALALADRITHRLLQRELADLRDAHATLSHLKPWLLPGGPDFNAAFFANLSHAGDATARSPRLRVAPEARRLGYKLGYDPGAVPGIAHPIGVLASTTGVDSIPRHRADQRPASRGSTNLPARQPTAGNAPEVGAL